MRKGIYTYHGIPYAEAKERFVRAERVTPWQDVRLAVDYGAIAPQGKGGFPNTTWEDPAREFPMDNNCQNLNIWTPGIADGKKRPVMVWLHGGGFSAGSSAEIPAYDGANLSRAGDVVVVSVNNWDAYTLQGGTTMMFDADTKLVHHHDAELLKLLAPAQ